MLTYRKNVNSNHVIIRFTYINSTIQVDVVNDFNQNFKTQSSVFVSEKEIS